MTDSRVSKIPGIPKVHTITGINLVSSENNESFQSPSEVYCLLIIFADEEETRSHFLEYLSLNIPGFCIEMRI